MITIQPLVSECPPDLVGNEKLVMNVCINGKRFNLQPFTAEKIAKHTQLDLREVAAAIEELAKKNLIYKDEWA